MAGLVDTTEMYLRTILDLEEEGIVPLRARISERLGHSGPTVSQTVARMERDGLVVVQKDRRLDLTEVGRQKATRVLRKHRIAEALLAEVIGLDLAQVHDEACRWEHVMSDEAEQRIFELLRRPRESPYGTPIPGLEEFGVAAAGPFLDGVVSLDDAVVTEPRRLLVRRFGEPLQADVESLTTLQAAGVLPGTEILAAAATESVRVEPVEEPARAIVLGRSVAEHLYVSHPTKD